MNRERLKDLILKNYYQKERQEKEQVLFKSRKEVDINFNGSGYTIKEGPDKGKTLGHIQIPKRVV